MGIVLALLFARGKGFVDAIDPGTDGVCNRAGIWITRRIASSMGLDVRVTEGFSPHDLAYAVRPSLAYDVAFVDGLHTNEQLTLDVSGIEPYMAEKAVLLLHDIFHSEMHTAVEHATSSWRRHVIRGKAYRNLLGTVLLHRGFPPEHFADL